jgi:subtilase family serine protease
MSGKDDIKMRTQAPHPAPAIFELRSTQIFAFRRKNPLPGYSLRLIICLICGAVAASAAELKRLPGHLPEIVHQLKSQGRLGASHQLHLAIGLPLRNGAKLNDFLAHLYDPASPHFRQFLNEAEFTACFGPTEADYTSVQEFAQSNGLTITAIHGNRLVLDVVGPAVAVERAFHLALRTYRHPTEARDFFAPDAEPTVDAALPMVDVEGLTDYWRPHSKLCLSAPSVSRQFKSGSSPDGSGSFFGDDFRKAYAPGVTLTGAGESVGLLEFDGFHPDDIKAYAMAAGNGRTNISIQTVLVDNYDGVPTTGSHNGNVEVSLDIEMAMAMAPGLAGIVVFEAGPSGLPNDLLESMLAAGGTVKNLSCSWGWSGGPSITTGTIFTNMAAVGQSFFNASGDSDAFTTGSNSVNGVDNAALDNAPSSNPIITQVGGTTLSMTGDGDSYAAETVWNRDFQYSSTEGVGSSGGTSSSYSIPDWQTNVFNLSGAGGSTLFRNIPDVALTADDVYVVSGGQGVGAGGNGGTSCAAPLWAGFVALVNQQASARGLPPVGFINPALYTLAASPNYGACFHDVTIGNNTWSGSPNSYYATNGYDLCTGLGTPNGTGLINALANLGYFMVSPLSGAAAGVAAGPFRVSSGNFQLTNSGSFALDWSLVNTSAWLAFSATNGALAAGAQTNLSANLTAVAATLPLGTYVTSLVFSNLTFQVAEVGVFTLQVNQPLVVSPTNGFTSSGTVGGPFGVSSQTYTLTNLSGSPLAWGVINTSLWLAASPAAGTLEGGAQTNLTISLTSTTSILAAGLYRANVGVTNPNGVAASLPFSLSIRQPIVDNGGFETGNFSGWMLNGSTAFNVVTSSGVFVHSGTYGAALAQFGSPGDLAQTLPTVAGQNYLLSLWLENPTNPAGATPNQFFVQWNGVTLFNQTNIPFTAWTNLQFIVTASGANTPLLLGFDDTPYYLGLDDISVTSLSPPQLVVAQTGSGIINLSWSTLPTLVYQVQYQTNLLQANWINLGTPLPAGGNTLTFTDTNLVSALPGRFYRIVELP